MSFTLRRVAIGGILASMVHLLGSAPACGASLPGLRSADPGLGPMFQVVTAEARRLLEKPSCGRIFEEFQDSRTGRPLAASLSETGLGAVAYFESLSFLDGTGTAPCLRPRIQAYTTIGGSTIHVCRAQLYALQKHDWLAAGSTLVHEALHTLGLGENPPPPAEITHRILQHCGW
jgi:hypothetical protein